jgi:hypothetical protein
MTEYGFDPRFILKSLISIYISFKSYREFLEFVVRDERAYKIENFERVLSLKESEKISIPYDEYMEFEKMIDKLKHVEAEIKSQMVIKMIMLLDKLR